MTQLKAFLFSLCLSCACTATTFAQIQKGNYNFGGDVGLFTASSSSNVFKSKELKLSLSPSVGKFLTNEWFMSVQPILSTQALTTKRLDIGPIYESNLTETNLGLGFASRYYLRLNDKISFFGLASVAYARQLSDVSLKSTIAGNDSRKYNANLLSYVGGIGLNVGIKRDIFFETTLSYNASEYRGGGFSYKPDKYKDFSLNCGINHFIVSPKKANFDDATFIKKGRQMLGGGLLMSKTNDYLSIVANPKFSQIVANNLLLSGEVSFQSVKGNGTSYQTITATVASRYYFPIQKRLFVYPELAYTRREEILKNFYSDPNYSKNELAIGLGGNYFLSENVALEATFLKARFNVLTENSEQKNLAGLIGLGNIGVVYFIR